MNLVYYSNCNRNLHPEKIALNQTNLCIAIRSKKNFFHLKKYLYCFFLFKLKKCMYAQSNSTCVMWFTEIFSLIWRKNFFVLSNVLMRLHRNSFIKFKEKKESRNFFKSKILFFNRIAMHKFVRFKDIFIWIKETFSWVWLLERKIIHFFLSTLF